MDLLLHVIRDDDDRLRGTVTRAGGTPRTFSGTLELMRVFEELVPVEPGGAPEPSTEE